LASDNALNQAKKLSTLSDIPLMPGARTNWVAKHAVLLGVPASIRTVTHNSSWRDVRKYYKDAWSVYGPVIERRFGEWNILMSRWKDVMVSLHTHSKQPSTQSLLMVSEIPDAHKHSRTDPFGLSTLFELIGHQAYEDAGKHALNLTYRTTLGVGSASSTTTTQLQGLGWTLLLETTAQHMTDGVVLRFSQAGKRIQLVIGRDPKWGEHTFVWLTSMDR
jgi:hypothetical protein